MKNISKKIFYLLTILLITSGADCTFKELFLAGKDPVNLQLGDVMTVINSVINWLVVGIGSVSALFLMIGGFRYITSLGNPEEAQKAKNTMFYAIIGLVIALSAFMVIKFITGFLLK